MSPTARNAISKTAIAATTQAPATLAAIFLSAGDDGQLQKSYLQADAKPFAPSPDDNPK